MGLRTTFQELPFHASCEKKKMGGSCGLGIAGRTDGQSTQSMSELRCVVSMLDPSDRDNS